MDQRTDNELTEGPFLPHPRLVWKPPLLRERPLKPVKHSTVLPNSTDAFAFVDLRKGKGVFLVTRVSNGWAIFEYKTLFICEVTFSKLRIGGLPLGGDTRNPHTYIVDGRGKISRITYLDPGYRLESTVRPTVEPSETHWVAAVVPTPESNDGKFLTWLPRTTLRPTADNLQATQRWINENMPGTKIKAGGSQHAWSQIANTDHIYILPDDMKSPLRFIDEEPDVYRGNLGERRGNLVRGATGVTIREANKFLWERGKAFHALGGFDGQTLGGVFNTGTHGSCFSVGPMAEIIVSIELVLADGTMVRIEPDDGVTDPESFTAHYPNMKLRQDNDYFYSALINMGTMGIVHSYVIEVTDAFHLKEVRTATTIAALKAKLQGGKIYELAGDKRRPVDIERAPVKISDGKDGGFAGHPLPAFHIEFVFNPHGDQVVITSREPIDIPDEKAFGWVPLGRDLVRTILIGARFSRPLLPTFIQDRYRRFLVWLIDTISHTFPKSNPWLIDRAISTLVDKAYLERSFNVFNVGEGQNDIPALSGTIFLPLENDMYLEALDVILAVAKQFASRGKYETAPVSMRFVRKTEALLGCPKDFCGFECIFTASTKHAAEMIDAYDLALRQKFNGEVRPHWGQILRDPDPEQIRSMYPRYDRWREIRDELDPQGLFLNDWQEKVLPGPVAS